MSVDTLLNYCHVERKNPKGKKYFDIDENNQKIGG